jgi:hypothetical protein
MTLNSNERAALAILAGCPTGATEYNLVTLHNVKPATLYHLVERGLIHPQERTIRPPWNFVIVWVSLTDAGRAAIKTTGD